MARALDLPGPILIHRAAGFDAAEAAVGQQPVQGRDVLRYEDVGLLGQLVELAHSGRAEDAFPAAQVRSLAWLLRTLLALSGGRVTMADVYGHKDLDRRPAYLRSTCERPGCPYFVDERGRALRRRVDPPESLFAALAREGLALPRARGDDTDLRRSEALAPGERPAVAWR